MACICPCLLALNCFRESTNTSTESSIYAQPQVPVVVSDATDTLDSKVIEDSPEGASDRDFEQVPELEFLGEHFPETRLRILSADELGDWEFKQVRYAINEMFARHGAEFQTPSIRKQFQTMTWYKPVPGRNAQSMLHLLSEIERQNLKLLGTRRKELERSGQGK